MSNTNLLIRKESCFGEGKHENPLNHFYPNRLYFLTGMGVIICILLHQPVHVGWLINHTWPGPCPLGDHGGLSGCTGFWWGDFKRQRESCYFRTSGVVSEANVVKRQHFRFTVWGIIIHLSLEQKARVVYCGSLTEVSMMTSSNGNIFRVTGHMRSFEVFFDLRLNKRLSKQSWSWWFETLSHSLWSHSNACACSK